MDEDTFSLVVTALVEMMKKNRRYESKTHKEEISGKTNKERFTFEIFYYSLLELKVTKGTQISANFTQS